MENRIGILGGTFNPIHIGHILMCQHSLESLDLKKVFLMPNEKPPHKSDNEIIDGIARLEMCKIVSNNNDFISYIDYEIGSNKTAYTIDTLKFLKKNRFENDEIYFIIGADSLMNIDSWKNYKELLKIFKIICLKRPGIEDVEFNSKFKVIKDQFPKSLFLVEMPLTEISSSEIRKRIKNDLSVKNMIDTDVERYINKNKLYRG